MAEQRAALIELGCPLGQGHHFSPAVPAEAIERMLAGQRSLIPRYLHAS
jgi:EAL domain-containing protein (putative c-di-GMP-specific phosphodiesterase class I)